MSVPGSALKPGYGGEYSLNTGVSARPTYHTAASPRKKPYIGGYEPSKPLFNRVYSYVDNKVANLLNKSSREEVPLYSANNKAENVKKMLILKCLEKSLFSTPKPLTAILGLPKGAFSLASISQAIQMAIQIAVICLCAQAMKNDLQQISHSVWAYLIAQGLIVLAISTLFCFRVIRMSRNGAIFYSLVAWGLSIAGFGVVLGCIMTKLCSNTKTYCHIRKGVTGIVCLSAFLWLIELVTFLTIIYVSRLNIIPDPYEEDAFNVDPAYIEPIPVPEPAFSTNPQDSHQFLKTPASIFPPPPPQTADTAVPEDVKKFIVTETGLDEVTDPSQLIGKKRVEIYAVPETPDQGSAQV